MPSFIFFIKSLKTKDSLYLFFSSFFFFAALFTKETAIVIPAIYALYIFSCKIHLTKKEILKYAVVFTIPAFLYLAARSAVFSQSVKNIDFHTLILNAVVSLKTIIWYLGAFMFTEKLFLYPQIEIGFSHIAKGLIPVIFPAIAVYILRKNLNMSMITFGLLWFIVFLIPPLAMPDNNFYTHRLYIPSMGILIVFAEIITPLIKNYNILKKIFLFFAVVLIVFLSAASYKQSLYYKNRESFWLRALEENPNSSRVNAGTARYYESVYNYENFEKYTLRALKYVKNARDTAAVSTQAGRLYYAKKDYEKARNYFVNALSANKYYEPAYYFLSCVYQDNGETEKAKRLLLQEIEKIPGSVILR
jgi:tetratricopeptide (TPR) repeat protein